MSKIKPKHKSLPHANFWLYQLEGVLRIVDSKDDIKELRENTGIKKGVETYLKSHLGVISVKNDKVNLTKFGKEILKLYDESKMEEVLRQVIKKSFETNDIYQVFLDFFDKKKGRRCLVKTITEITDEFHDYCEENDINYSRATTDINFQVLYNTFLISNLLLKNKNKNIKGTDLSLNVKKLQDYGLIEKPREFKRWPLVTFISELIESYYKTKKRVGIQSFILNQRIDGVKYNFLKSNVIVRLNIKYKISESDKVFDSIFWELTNKYPNLIETHKLIGNIIVIIHAKKKEDFKIW